MKRFLRLSFLPLLVVLVSTSLPAQTNKPLTDNKSVPPTPTQHPVSGYLATADGFRGIKYGTELSSLTGFKLDQDQGAIKFYIKKNDKLTLGPIKLEAIVYHFFNDKLFGVSLHTNTEGSTESLLRVAQTLFGNGSNPNESQEVWKGKKISAIYSVNPKDESGVLLLLDNALESEKETYLAKASEEALKDL
jgi:hypothetical protein